MLRHLTAAILLAGLLTACVLPATPTAAPPLALPVGPVASTTTPTTPMARARRLADLWTRAPISSTGAARASPTHPPSPATARAASPSATSPFYRSPSTTPEPLLAPTEAPPEQSPVAEPTVPPAPTAPPGATPLPTRRPTSTTRPTSTATPTRTATRTATPSPTASPCPTVTPTPSAPYTASARVSDASPTGSTVTIYARLVGSNGVPVAGAQVRADVHYRSITTTWPTDGSTVATGDDGIASIKVNYGTARGYTITVEFFVTYQGQTYKPTTAFTPQ